MKKTILLIISLLVIQITAYAVQDSAYAPYVAVMTDHILDPPTTYYNYPATSELFANEVVNELRLRKNMRIIGASDVKEIIKMTTLTPQLKQFVNQYRTNYNIDFTKLRQFAQALGVDNILLITSSMDYQSYVMKGTIWNLINFPGADVVNPVYQVVTNATLVDVKAETIVWHHVYRKNLKARDNSIIPASFAPNTQQLKAINDYSKALSFQVANSVEEHVCSYLYFDKLGNRYNRKSNSLVGKTKYYTRDAYERYVGVDVPGPPVAQRAQKHKENRAKYSEYKKRENAIKKEQKKQMQTFEASKKQNEQKFVQNEAQAKTHQNIEKFDEGGMEINQSETIAPNPQRDYIKSDSLQLTPMWAPNAYGNRIEDL